MEKSIKKGDVVKILRGYNSGFVGITGEYDPSGYWSILTRGTTCWAPSENLELVWK